MDQKSFFLTVAHATGLPIRDPTANQAPTTCVRCKVQSTQATLFCTPYHPQTTDPVFDHKEVLAARYRFLIFEVIDADNQILGGFKIDAQVIYEGLLKCRDPRILKMDYPLNADRTTLLTLSYQLITNPNPNPNPNPIPGNVYGGPLPAMMQSTRGENPLARSTPDAFRNRPGVRSPPGDPADGPRFPVDPNFIPRGTSAPGALGPGNDMLSRSGSASGSPNEPLFARGTGPVRAKQSISPVSTLTHHGPPHSNLHNPPLVASSGSVPLNSGPGSPPLNPSFATQLMTSLANTGLVPQAPNPHPQSPPNEAIHSQCMPLQEAIKLQENYKNALLQISQLQNELKQTQEALAQAQALLAAQAPLTPTAQPPPPVAIPTSPQPPMLSQPSLPIERKQSDAPLPESRCEICNAVVQGAQRVLSLNHIFCRKCAVETRQNLGKNVNSPEALAKYIAEKTGVDPLASSPEAELASEDTQPQQPPPLAASGSFRLFSIENSINQPVQQPRPHATLHSTPSTFNLSLTGVSTTPTTTPNSTPSLSSSAPVPHPTSSRPENKRDSREYFVEQTQSDSLSEEETEKEVLVDFYIPESPSNILYSESDGDLRAATFTMLITKLTQMPSIVDIDDFLLTYRSFTTPAQLVDALVTRFDQVRPDDARIVHLRIFNIFSRWISNFWFDFSTDITCAAVTSAFLDKIMADPNPNNANNAIVAKTVKTKLEKKTNTPPGGGRKIFTDETPTPIPEKDPNQPLIYADPLEIARQMTVRTWETWVAMKPWEFLGLAWTKHGKETKAYNVLKMTQQFNHFSNWVSSTIISAPRPTDRVKLVKKFLDIAGHLKAMGNFNGVMEIWSGLQRQPVFRMSQTHQEVIRDRRYHQLWTELAELNDRDRNFGNLRAAIQAANPPVIPYLGMYQSDLVFIEEGNPKKIGELINYFKCRAISATIKKIQQYQQKPPAFQKVASIMIKLEFVPIIDSEEDMYAISTYHEPREGKEPGPRPPALDAYLQKSAKHSSPGGVSRKTKASFTSTGKRRSDPMLPQGGVLRSNSVSGPQVKTLVSQPKRTSRPPTDYEKDMAEQLCSASWNGNLETVKMLLSLANSQNFLNLPNTRGQPALYCASRQGHVDIVLELLNNEAIDIAGTNSEHGSTPLHAASFSDQPEVVCLLLFAGADPLRRLNKNGLNARSEARGSTLDVYAQFDQAFAASNGEESFEAEAQSLLQKLRTAYPTTNLLKRPIIPLS